MAKNQRHTGKNISNVKVGTWVRGILLIISLVNMALSAAGKAPIPADYNEIYTVVSVVISRCSSAYRLIGKITALLRRHRLPISSCTSRGSAIEDRARTRRQSDDNSDSFNLLNQLGLFGAWAIVQILKLLGMI